MTIHFVDGGHSTGTHIGIYSNNRFQGSVGSLEWFMDHLYEITHVALLREAGAVESAIVIYPKEAILRIIP